MSGRQIGGVPLLEKNAQLYNDALMRRKSRRLFDSEPLSESQLATLQSLEVEPLGLAPLRTHFVHRPGGLDHVFRGVLGSYGKILGASALLAFTAAESDTWAAAVECGYVGEQFVLMAESLGLGSCWNGGMFGIKQLMGLVPLGPNERVVSLVALGTPKAGPDVLSRLTKLVFKRKDIAQIASSALLGASGYIAGAVEAVRLAPSAINRQPWYLDISKEGGVVLTATKQGSLVPIDLGIAMLHFRTSALVQGVHGKWEVKAADRAVFRPLSGHH